MKMTQTSRFYLSIYPLAYKVYRKLGLPTRILNAKKHSIIKRHILANYEDVMEKYKTMDYASQSSIGKDSPIWIMWWQGEETMPETVKICCRRVRELAGNHEIHLITKKTYCKYITTPFPLLITDCLSDGTISITYFSDIMRCYLLYTYGGIWMDATLLPSSLIDDFVGTSSFYTGRRVYMTDNYNVAQGKWTSYLSGSVKGNPFYLYMYEMLVTHIQKEGTLLDYFMVDYFFILAYEYFPFVRKMVEKVPPVLPLLNEMMSRMNILFDKTEYERLIDKVPYHKLGYKTMLQEKTDNGGQTYYGFLKENIHGNDK